METPESQAWALVSKLNKGIAISQTRHKPDFDSLTARQTLAEYFKLVSEGGIRRPSNVHSAILSIGVKMAIRYPDFRFVPFLDMWGLQNLRPEDSEGRVDSDGKRWPSLVEQMAKSYAYSLLFHPQEHIEKDLENLLYTNLALKGYQIVGEERNVCQPVLALSVYATEVRTRKITFVYVVTASGQFFSTEIHTLTELTGLRYSEIPGKVFSAVLRRSPDKGADAPLRIEAATLSPSQDYSQFTTSVGYIEFLDLKHSHTHIYDGQSRHFVAKGISSSLSAGDYVLFVPCIPENDKFKSAYVLKKYEATEGREAFGYLQAKVTYTDQEKGYCAWELVAGTPPIVETGTTEPSFTKGYINKQLCSSLSMSLPSEGTYLDMIVFLKRGKDKQKRPHVVWFKLH